MGATAPRLQQLAWLDEQGNIKSNNNGLLGASAPRLQQLAWMNEAGEISSVGNGLLGASAPVVSPVQLMNLGLLSGMKDKAIDSGFVNTDGLGELNNRVDGLKSQASDLKDSTIDTAAFAGSLVDTDAVKAAAAEKAAGAAVVAG